MRKTQLISLAAIAAISGYASTTHAHFKLLSPDSWLMEDASGGPQKGSPCGTGGADDVNPPPVTNKVTEYHAGEEIEVKWVDTIAHPGHFRIALAENRTDLKDPAIKQDSFCSYDEDMVKMMTASGNVLADVVSFRSRTGFSAQAGTMFSQKVKLPDTPCDKCTLQVMQVMENDIQSLSNCYYFHCADIKILPAAGGATAGAGAAGAAAGASGAASGAGGSSTAGATAGTAGSSTGASGAAAGASGSVASGASGAAGAARAGSPATSAAGSSASAAGSSATPAAGSVATSGAAGTAAGTPATGTTTNAVTGMGASSGDSSGCSVTGVGSASNALPAIFVASVMVLMNARRRRRELRKRADVQAYR